MTVEMKWIEDLPGRPHEPRRGFYTPRGGSKDLFDHAAQLVAHPLRWAEYPREVRSPKQARDIATYIQEGKLAAYAPNKGFEATYRGGNIYIRHNPAYVSPITRAFYEGEIKGRREALSGVKALTWTYRQGLQELEGWDEARSRDAQ